MNIHEYQAKDVLKSFGAPVASGVAITSADEAAKAAAALPGPLYVVKSQIHAADAARAGSRSSGPTPRAASGWPNPSTRSLPTPATCSATRSSPSRRAMPAVR